MTSAEHDANARRLALGGIIGPTAFVAAWALGAFANDRDLSAVDDAISQLAHVDSNTRWLMTAGLVTFGVGVGMFAAATRSLLGNATAWALGATALSTLVVAALPLGASDTVDRLHAVAAGVGYVTLAVAPLAASASLHRLGHRRLARMGGISSTVAALSLATSLTSAPTGLFQRIGLTAVDLWLVAVAFMIACGRLDHERRLTAASGDAPCD